MLRTGIGLISALIALGAWAQDKPLTAQQERMKACNQQAAKKALKGDERKSFMSDCLKTDDKLTAQQQRMKSCNEEAGRKQLKGDARKGFMSRCLKGDKVANSQQERMTSCNAQASRRDLKGDQRTVGSEAASRVRRFKPVLTTLRIERSDHV